MVKDVIEWERIDKKKENYHILTEHCEHDITEQVEEAVRERSKKIFNRLEKLDIDPHLSYIKIDGLKFAKERERFCK